MRMPECQILSCQKNMKLQFCGAGEGGVKGGTKHESVFYQWYTQCD